jgi:hypothetical protein
MAWLSPQSGGLYRRSLRQSIGADCEDCGWQSFGDVRNEAKAHAQEQQHTTRFTVEETTIYKAKLNT